MSKKKTIKRVPRGRTLTTYDNYLGKTKTNSKKKRPVVVIESDNENNLAVVPLSSREGVNRTQLKNYQQGQSYYKHYVEIEDNKGASIRINEKFRENHKNQDVSQIDVLKMKNTVFYHSKPAVENRKKINKFRGKKKPRD